MNKFPEGRRLKLTHEDIDVGVFVLFGGDLHDGISFCGIKEPSKIQRSPHPWDVAEKKGVKSNTSAVYPWRTSGSVATTKNLESMTIKDSSPFSKISEITPTPPSHGTDTSVPGKADQQDHP
ncbi:hypothetical protein BS50DRAFT_586640 [Corynespora cassiicola Philippines]|uniref:Uncharacterized protein n=1 Tax=Corynespora cassiicola Philippines TaxID=1448308 RepID=A0A2T2NW51_CORCC|nr:hypothetical protein BS50DRAFT_586640 [Corynespora cassiicola Philippines]